MRPFSARVVWKNYADTVTRRDSIAKECGDTIEAGNTIFFDQGLTSPSGSRRPAEVMFAIRDYFGKQCAQTSAVLARLFGKVLVYTP
jgi:hypothetical protein